MRSEPAIDRARFAPEDATELVAAALCCGWCLRAPEVVRVGQAPLADGGVATCECARCARTTRVVLDRDQVLRLLLAPPEHLETWFESCFA